MITKNAILKLAAEIYPEITITLIRKTNIGLDDQRRMTYNETRTDIKAFTAGKVNNEETTMSLRIRKAQLSEMYMTDDIIHGGIEWKPISIGELGNMWRVECTFARNVRDGTFDQDSITWDSTNYHF